MALRPLFCPFFSGRLRQVSLYHQLSNSSEPDQARHFVWPDLGPNCLLRSTEEETSR